MYSVLQFVIVQYETLARESVIKRAGRLYRELILRILDSILFSTLAIEIGRHLKEALQRVRSLNASRVKRKLRKSLLVNRTIDTEEMRSEHAKRYSCCNYPSHFLSSLGCTIIIQSRAFQLMKTSVGYISVLLTVRN